MNRRWYEEFFHGIALEMWRRAIPPERTRLEVDFLERALGLRRGSSVLDVPCGHGRHAIELAARGARVTGVDISPEQIETARKDAAAAGVEVEWSVAPMQDLTWRGAFDAAYCLGNSFGYQDPDGTRAFLAAVSGALRPGGRFVLDYGVTAESILPRLRDREWAQIDDILFLEENRYHLAESCIETTYTFVRGGRVETRNGLQWVHTLREVRDLLAGAGLMAESPLASIDGEPFQVGSPCLYLVAEKTPAGGASGAAR